MNKYHAPEASEGPGQIGNRIRSIILSRLRPGAHAAHPGARPRARRWRSFPGSYRQPDLAVSGLGSIYLYNGRAWT